MQFQEYKGQILGTDSSGNPIKIKVDSDGQLQVDVLSIPSSLVDNISGAINNITIEHAEIHNGNVFSILYKYLVPVGTSIYIQIKTGSKTVHLKPTNFSTDGDKFIIEFFENPTLTDGTSPITMINRNRTSSNTPLTVFYSDPAVTSDGTKIDEFYIGGTYGQKTIGGDIIAGVNEFVLSPNANYLYKITNDGAADAIILTRLFFYEK